MAGGYGQRLLPMTKVVNKHFLPVYDRPMIFYPLAALVHFGVTEVLLITSRQDLGLFQCLLGDGCLHGVDLQYAVQEEPRGIPDGLIVGAEFARGEPVMFALGDNLLFMRWPATSLTPYPLRGARVFAQAKADASEYAVVELDERGKPISLVEKPIPVAESTPQLAVSGFYMFDGRAAEIARTLKPSARGELEIVDVLEHYRRAGELEVCVLPEGCWWTDAGTPERLMEAALVEASGLFRGDAFDGH